LKGERRKEKREGEKRLEESVLGCCCWSWLASCSCALLIIVTSPFLRSSSAVASLLSLLVTWLLFPALLLRPLLGLHLLRRVAACSPLATTSLEGDEA